MAVTLYTSRVVLKVLGVNDYGIYNLIAGFVTFLSFITNALVYSMQRYFNVSLGLHDEKRYREVFSMSINILLLFSICIILIGETIGLWFVSNYLNIPAERNHAALWVYHISVVTFVVNSLRTPFHASIIAHERMSFYAYVSIAEVLLRLAMTFVLLVIPADHLIMYALLYFLVILFVNILYSVYCTHNFKECKYIFVRDNALFKELMSFSGWSLLGQSAVVVKNQGEAILVNRFFSVASNAALGVAGQVTNAIEMFVTNFQTAFSPQITQLYASGDIEEHHKLLQRSSKLSFYLLLILMIPVTFNISAILDIWLVDVPEYTEFFVIFILISYLFNALGSPLSTSVFASGNIKKYQWTLTIIFLAGLLLAFVGLKLGCKPYIISVFAIVVQFLLLLSRLFFCKVYAGLSLKSFLLNVFVPVCRVTLFVWIIPLLMLLFAKQNLFVDVAVDLCTTCIIIYFLGFNEGEKIFLKQLIKQKITC